MKSPLRLHARTVLLIVAALLLAAWLLPPFLHAGRYRRVLKAGLENKLGRPVELGAVSVRLLPHPGFSIDNVRIEEDPRFGSEPFARVDRVECDLRWRSLWGSRLDCARILLEHPDLNLVRNDRGRWNIEDFFLRSDTVSGIRSPGSKMSPATGFELDVDDAHLNFISGITKTAWAVTGLNGGLALDPSGGSIRFRFTGSPVRTGLTLPAAPGAIELSGEWKPGKDFHGPFNALIHTEGSLLYGWIPLLTGRNPEIYGVASAVIHAAGRVDRLRFRGEARLDQLHRWESLPPSSSMPVAINFAGSYDRPQRRLDIQTADAAFAGSHLHLAGTISYFPAAPRMDVVLAVERSHLSDIVSMVSRLSGRHPALEVSGRVDGLLTIQGPWREKRYGGFVGVRSFRLREHAITFKAPELGVQIDKAGARLLPVRLVLGPHIECVAKGSLFPAFPGGLHETVGTGGTGARPATLRDEHPSSQYHHRILAPPTGSRYELTLSTARASLPALTRLARSLGVRPLRELNAEGWADATVGVAGTAWPFTMPRFTAEADLEQAQFFVPGLTEPVRFRRFHLEVRDDNIRINPLVAQIGSTVFTGWLSHQEESRTNKNPWEFSARTPRLSLEQASLWFAALGHKSPLPILDLIPGLSSLVAGRRAGRNIFASLRAQGAFESPLITFRSIRLRNVRAGMSIAGRVAAIHNVSFGVAGGQGRGSGQVNFKRTPAQISGKFSLQGGRLDQLAQNFPPALGQVRGVIFAIGHFTTRGLTRQEMKANLQGEARLSFKNISFGRFDPLQAVARAASLGSLQPERGPARLSSALVKLRIAHQLIDLRSSRVLLSGATLDLKGDYGFSGATNLLIHADLNGVRRRWASGARASLIAADSSPGGALPDSLPEDQLTDLTPPGGATKPGQSSNAPRVTGALSFPLLLGQQGRVAILRLAGPLNGLAVVRGAERAKLAPN